MFLSGRSDHCKGDKGDGNGLHNTKFSQFEPYDGAEILLNTPSLTCAANGGFVATISEQPSAGFGRVEPPVLAATVNAYSRPICAIRDRPLRVSLISSSALGLTANND
jgi:hypothetical protein